ncbi:MAG TPA: hypothetical protein VLD55_05835 [Candidatus Sulfobium mesophilum]|nr:hypothetical protein [Candidatus Sulfobium mesophilum]
MAKTIQEGGAEMKRLAKWLEDVFAAITFSEVGEHGIAQEFLAVPVISVRTNATAETHLLSHIPLVPEGDP